MRIDTVVLPVAGKGTRLLPLTKAVPKELLPVYDKPVLQFAVEEALAAGAQNLVIITHDSKPAIREYFAPAGKMIDNLHQSGKSDLAAAMDAACIDDRINVVVIEQPEPLGLGHAVSLAERHVRRNPFGVILPDDCILGAPCLPSMADAYLNGNMIAAQEVPKEDVSKYGIFNPCGSTDSDVLPVSGLVEKPEVADAPSQLAAVGRYILDHSIFESLRKTTPGAGGEIQLTDAIAASLPAKALYAYRFAGTRFDCGTQDGLVAAAVARQEALNTQADAA